MEGTFEPTGIKSSISDDVTYNSTTNQMHIVYLNKARYEYDEIVPADIESVKDADSTAKKLKEIIKGKVYRRIME